jgi:ABC-type transporter Mla subunit MlaD
MQLQRNEIMTGVLVVGTVAVLVFILILLAAPGLFRPLVTYKLYFDNASGIKLGAPVMLAGRKIGQVASLNSPVSREEAAAVLEAAGNLGTVVAPPSGARQVPLPRFEVRIDVEVDGRALVYKNAKVRLMTLGLLGETAIDIAGGNDHSKRAEGGQVFAGERVPEFSEAIAEMLEVIKPVASEATSTMKELETTAQNLSRLTDENSELNLALGEFKTFGEHLVDLSAPDGALSQSLNNIEKISTELTANHNINVSLQNFRDSSERLKATMNDLGPAGRNIKDFSETVKTQPWRLIWPSTKKYPEEQRQASTTASAGQTINVRKSTRRKATPTPTPTRRSLSRE